MAVLIAAAAGYTRYQRILESQTPPPAVQPDELPAEQPAAPLPVAHETVAFDSDRLNVCSFNIKFVGSYKAKQDEMLADMLSPYDVVVVQELVAPPTAGTYPNGEGYNADAEAKEFFYAMQAEGFHYVLSEEDTGRQPDIHKSSTSTEWFVTFFKPAAVAVANDLPGGFLDADRSANPHFDRVPYAFPFRTSDGKLDFVIVSVHLRADSGPDNRERRRTELAAIGSWVDANDAVEGDFIILGDMNIYSSGELENAIPDGFISLNDECEPTNMSTAGPRPYDQVFVRPAFTSEVDNDFDFQVVDLLAEMQDRWTLTEPFPNDRYKFEQNFSDHKPVVFQLVIPGADDD